MKRAILFMVFLCWGGIAISQNIKKVAVYITGEAESGYKKVIGSKMVSGITKSEGYVAVERTADFLAALAKEQDYQTSGAVNDSQIVRLGQQFGVRLVAVVDVSEVFEAIFISTRMIDVQTGQIIGSAETNKAVNNIEGLVELSENVVTKLLSGIIEADYIKDYMNHFDVKVIGPFATAKELYDHTTSNSEGYHIATEEEMKILIASYKQAQKPISFPIYANISSSPIKSETIGARGLTKWSYCMTTTLFKLNESIVKNINFYRILDTGEYYYNDIIPGFIYLLKEK